MVRRSSANASAGEDMIVRIVVRMTFKGKLKEDEKEKKREYNEVGEGVRRCMEKDEEQGVGGSRKNIGLLYWSSFLDSRFWFLAAMQKWVKVDKINSSSMAQ